MHGINCWMNRMARIAAVEGFNEESMNMISTKFIETGESR
jgi:hypothetical protein